MIQFLLKNLFITGVRDDIEIIIKIKSVIIIYTYLIKDLIYGLIYKPEG